jgi:catechol 2,3-dioxygenase-like lactoylglutathione lyase family enzyme
VLKGLHHTALSTPDLERLVAFYRDQFGFAVAFEFAWDETNPGFRRTHAGVETRGRVAMLERGASRLELFEYAKPAPRPVSGLPGNADHGLRHLAFEVTDIEAEVARLRAAGVPFLSAPVAQANVKVCYGRDPDGNLFELIEWFDHVVEAVESDTVVEP